MQVYRLQICSQVGGRQVIRQVGRQIVGSQADTHSQAVCQSNNQPASPEARQPVQKPGRQLRKQAGSYEARQAARKPGRQPVSQVGSQEARQPARKPDSQPGSQAGSQEASKAARKSGKQPGSQAGRRQSPCRLQVGSWYRYCRFCAGSYKLKVLQVETVSTVIKKLQFLQGTVGLQYLVRCICSKKIVLAQLVCLFFFS